MCHSDLAEEDKEIGEGERKGKGEGEETLLGGMEHKQVNSLKPHLCVICVHVHIKS